MTEPVDLVSAASDGFIALLDAAIGPEIAEVTTNPTPIDPSDTSDRRFVIIGEIDSSSEGGKGEQAELLSVQVIVVYRGTQRSALHALMHQVRVALDGNVPDVAGVEFGAIEWRGAASSPAGADGITHAGIIEFEVFGEPA
ncbi:hypothetical protein [Sphingomonas sp.]|uniref:hypothetical protein n=1 Tax=Sphingomonas sp. TaxID=28214 RepID=UPI003BA84C44